MRALVVVFTQVVEVAGNEWVALLKVISRYGEGVVGKVLIKMLKCSDQLVPRVERFGSRTLRRWLEHRREKHDEGKRMRRANSLRENGNEFLTAAAQSLSDTHAFCV